MRFLTRLHIGALLVIGMLGLVATAPASAATAAPQAHSVLGFYDGLWIFYPTIPANSDCVTIASTAKAGSGIAWPGNRVIDGGCPTGLALSQRWALIPSIKLGGYEIVAWDVSAVGGGPLCITLAARNGSPDGGAVVVGNCAFARTQIFVRENNTHFGGIEWVDFLIRDAQGHAIALNIKNGYDRPGQPLNFARALGSYGSEDMPGAGCYSPVQTCR